MDPVIQLDNLEVRFGERAILNKLNASLTGQSIGLLGPNGAGKSTLLNTLLGFHQPSSGTARIFGQDIRTHARQVRSLVGYMPENAAFIAGMSGVRFVRLMAELAGLPRQHAIERAHEAFFYVGLGEVLYELDRLEDALTPEEKKLRGDPRRGRARSNHAAGPCLRRAQADRQPGSGGGGDGLPRRSASGWRSSPH